MVYCLLNMVSIPWPVIQNPPPPDLNVLSHSSPSLCAVFQPPCPDTIVPSAQTQAHNYPPSASAMELSLQEHGFLYSTSPNHNLSLIQPSITQGHCFHLNAVSGSQLFSLFCTLYLYITQGMYHFSTLSYRGLGSCTTYSRLQDP